MTIPNEDTSDKSEPNRENPVENEKTKPRISGNLSGNSGFRGEIGGAYDDVIKRIVYHGQKYRKRNEARHRNGLQNLKDEYAELQHKTTKLRDKAAELQDKTQN